MSLLLRRRAGGAASGATTTGGTPSSGGGTGGDTGSGTNPNFPTLSAAHSDGLVDIQSLNVHLDYGKSGGSTSIYKTSGLGQGDMDSTLAQAFTLLGIRHARETLITTSTTQRDRVNALHTAAGVDFKMACGFGGSIPTISAVQTAIAAFNAGAIESITPPNELDNNGPADWISRLTTYQSDLWGAYGGSGIRVGTGPLAHSASYNNWSGQPFQNQCDFVDLHPYPGGTEPQNHMDEFLTAGKRMATKTPEFSEEGYHNATQSTSGHLSAPEDVVGVYYPRLILEAWQRGVARMTGYELGDEYPDATLTLIQDHFGLFAYGWIPKPAAYSVAHLNWLHADAGIAYSPAGLQVKVNGPTDLKYTISGKRDGSYVIDMWRPLSIWNPAKSGAGTPKSVTSLPVTVTLPAAKTLTRYQLDGVAGTDPYVPDPAAAAVTADTVTFDLGAAVNVLTIG